MKFRKKPVVIDAITFDELVQYGRENGGNIVDGMPWSFTYKGHHISHERDDCYLIPTLEGTHNFTKEDMLITGVKGEIYPCKKDIFEATYEPAGYESDNLIFSGEMSRFDPVEHEIQAKGLTAPRVTPEDIEANIVDVEIVKHVSKSGQVLRFAVLTTRNGFAVVGKPSCAVSSANDNAEIGEKVAIDNSKEELWPLMGYELRSRLAALKCMTPEINGVTVQLSDIGIAADNGLPISADGSLADPELFGVVAICTNEQFDDACRETDGLNFGLALEALQRGHKLARAGWNGKGMFIYYVPANTYPAQTGAAKSHFGDGSMVPYNAYLAIKNVNETVSTWVPSVNDCLAEDWEVLP